MSKRRESSETVRQTVTTSSGKIETAWRMIQSDLLCEQERWAETTHPLTGLTAEELQQETSCQGNRLDGPKVEALILIESAACLHGNVQGNTRLYAGTS